MAAQNTPADPWTRLTEALDAARAAAAPQPVAEATPVEPLPNPEPVTPLHLMDPQEFHDHSRQVWNTVGTAMRSPLWQQRQPLSIEQLIAGEHPAA